MIKRRKVLTEINVTEGAAANFSDESVLAANVELSLGRTAGARHGGGWRDTT